MLRKLARPMVASFYISDGVDMVQHVDEHAQGTAMIMRNLRMVLPRQYYKQLPQDPAQLTKIVGGTKIAAGTTLFLGKFPRLSAGILALVSVPTVLARHAFWETQDPAEKTQRRQGFLTSMALLGGLFITSADTAGKPGLSWRAKKAARVANKRVQQALPTQSETQKFADSASDWFDEARHESEKFLSQASSWIGDTAHKATEYVEDNRDDWSQAARSFLNEAQANSKVARKKVVKAAAQAQERAQEAYDHAQEATGRRAKKASKKATKLQKNAEKAIARAQKKVGKKLN
ncbi:MULTISPECIES: DoxX family membrane protein [unclassified Corynebacterium]|uniref:DoxX family membrane protein n=1 Tax=unclassified Corynebacterium TaxID=2624378 RepID=UPI00216AA519|nr:MULTISPECIES: DoxX family protein [unclassified Corynebacterium]MCS4490746.1 DoxX family protein [Corynebacterium sp. ES2775-CONJ]MCS4492548.1 DoxX family protein [Corynebacterium sp. ES2715-CONJ3]MCS4532649.1 DoxX family protein [Corynebacterium sp. ES2730-CONJ]